MVQSRLVHTMPGQTNIMKIKIVKSNNICRKLINLRWIIVNPMVFIICGILGMAMRGLNEKVAVGLTVRMNWLKEEPENGFYHGIYVMLLV